MPDVFYRFYHRSEKNACPDLNGLCPRPSICEKNNAKLKNITGCCSNKLLKREMPLYIVRILVYWYRTQTMYVQWDSCDSSAFRVTNGVRQGGILSPKLFIVYMDDLSDQLNNSNFGGNFGSGQLVNHISYADDMCLLSFSTAGMQKLLNICDQYSNDHDRHLQ